MLAGRGSSFNLPLAGFAQDSAMTSGRRYYFLLPEPERPAGGVNVMLQAVDRLANEGYDTRLLHATPGYR